MHITFIVTTLSPRIEAFNGLVSGARYLLVGSFFERTLKLNVFKRGNDNNVCVWLRCCTIAMGNLLVLVVEIATLSSWLSITSMGMPKNKETLVQDYTVGSKIMTILLASVCSVITVINLLGTMVIVHINKRYKRMFHKPCTREGKPLHSCMGS
jgi:hypothetical protein